jgi:hypothetical protein
MPPHRWGDYAVAVGCLGSARVRTSTGPSHPSLRDAPTRPERETWAPPTSSTRGRSEPEDGETLAELMGADEPGYSRAEDAASVDPGKRGTGRSAPGGRHCRTGQIVRLDSGAHALVT